jgi:hypothetical protein
MPQPRDGLYGKMAGAESLTPSPGLDFSLERCASSEIKHAHLQTPVAMSENLCPVTDRMSRKHLKPGFDQGAELWYNAE